MQRTQLMTNPDAKFWNGLARKYATDPIDDMTGYERTLDCVAEHLGPHDRVLELGCGTGTTALHLARHSGSYHATDISTEMIAIAREKLAESGCTNLTFEAATARDGAPGQEAFDAVLAFNLLHLVEDLDETLRAILALTRPGGLFISKTACIEELNPLIKWGIPVARLLGKAPKNVLSFGEAELVDAVARAGFVVESVERHGTKGKDVRPYIVARRPA